MITYDNDVQLTRIFRDQGGTLVGVSWWPPHAWSFDYFRDSAAVNDATYFGWSYGVWHNLKINVGTALVASSITVVWEYWNGTAWATLTVTDPSNTFQNTGAHTISFDIPDNWVARIPHNVISSGTMGTTSQYNAAYIRCRITAVSGITEGGANTTAQVRCDDGAILLDGGTIVPDDILAADVAGGWGVFSKQGDAYLSLASIRIGDAYQTAVGDATNYTELILKECTLQVGTLEKLRVIIKKGNTVLQLGEKTGDATSRQAHLLYYNQLNINPWNGTYNRWAGDLNVYGSQILKLSGSFNDPELLLHNMDVLNSIIGVFGAGTAGKWWYFAPGCVGNVKDSIVQGLNTFFYHYATTVAVDNMKLSNIAAILGGSNGMVVSNIDFEATEFRVVNANTIATVLNCKFNNSLTQLIASSAGTQARETFEFEPSIIDEDGNAIENYTLRLQRADGGFLDSVPPLNGRFDYWTAGTAVAPDSWLLSGAGASVAREDTIVKEGHYSAKVTRTSAFSVLLNQPVVPNKDLAYWQGRQITVGAWVLADSINTGRLYFADGVTVTYSDYHTGSGQWEWIEMPVTVNAAALQVRMYLSVWADNKTVYFDGAKITDNNATTPVPPILTLHKFQSGSVTINYNPIEIWVEKPGYETDYRKIQLSNDTRKPQIVLKKAYDAMPIIGKGIAIKADPTNSTKDRDILIMG